MGLFQNIKRYSADRISAPTRCVAIWTCRQLGAAAAVMTYSAVRVVVEVVLVLQIGREHAIQGSQPGSQSQNFQFSKLFRWPGKQLAHRL